LFLPTKGTVSAGICETLGAERNSWTVCGASREWIEELLQDCVVLCAEVGDDIRDREVGWYGMWHVWVEESSTRWTRWKETTWKTLVEMGIILEYI
jgi:hypothetical protein